MPTDDVFETFAPRGDSGPREAILRVRDLGVEFRIEDTWAMASEGVTFDIDQRRGAGRRRRIGLGQVGVGDVDPRAAAAERPGQGQRDAARQGTDRRSRSDTAGSARQGHRADLPGADDGAQPGADGGFPGQRGAAQPFRHDPAGRQGACSGVDAAGRPAGSGGALQPLPASALRRAAAAHHDRDGAGLRPGAADRRRADDGAGRHGAGRDPRPAAGSAPPARLGDPADHP